jgi:hypothetical protein
VFIFPIFWIRMSSEQVIFLIFDWMFFSFFVGVLNIYQTWLHGVIAMFYFN